MRQKIAVQGMQPLYEQIELPLAQVLASMELWGIRVDLSVLDTFGAFLKGEIDQLEKSIHEMAGTAV